MVEERLEDIKILKWVERGGMLVNTEFLDIDDKDHVYNQIIEQGGIPEFYGYKHPLHERFQDWTREKLIKEIIRLESELKSIMIHL